MVVGTGRHLGQVGHGQHLAVAAQLPHEPAHGLGHRAADAAVDLVEDQGRRLAELAGGDRDRQRDARELAAGSDLADRPRRAARMAGDQELDVFQTVRLGFGQRHQPGLEAPARHAQALHRRRDGLRQLPGRLFARGADLPGRLEQGLQGALLGVLQGIEVAAAVELGVLTLPLGQPLGQHLGLAAEAPGQRQPQRQSLVERLERGRVEFGRIGMVLQVVAGILDLGQRALQHGSDLAIARLDMLLFLQRLQGPVQQLGRAAVFLVERQQRAARGIHQALCMRQPAMLQIELLPFALGRRQLGQLAELPLQALALLLQGRLLLLRLLERLQRLAPAGPESAQFSPRDAAIVVEQLAHRVGSRQALPGMLAVDVDQFLGQCLELGHRCRAAVDPGPAASLAVQAALEQQRLAGLDRKAVLVQPALRQFGQVEFRGDLAARRALAHHAGIGARAEGELQRFSL